MSLNEWVGILTLVVLTATLGAVLLYTYETRKLRIETARMVQELERQRIAAVEPYVVPTH